MNRSTTLCTMLLLASGNLALAGEHERINNTVIASTGTPAPAGGNYTSFLTVAFKDRHQVVFSAFLRGPSISGVFLADDAKVNVVALGGPNRDPALGNVGFIVSNPVIAGDEVAFSVLTFDRQNAFAESNGRRTSFLAKDGDAAPGGGTLQLGGNATANSHGTIAYRAQVVGAADTLGLFRTGHAGTVAIVTDNSVLPTGGTISLIGDPAINDRGQVAFLAGTTGGAADFGIFRGDGQGITTILAANQSAPGGTTLADFGDPVINKQGKVLSAVLLNRDGVMVGGEFVGDGAGRAAIAINGEPAPKGGNYNAFFGPLLLNDRGQVGFDASLTGGSSNRGVFRADRKEITVVALEGTAAPGTTGTFESFDDMKMDEDGTIAFIARLTLGVGGTDATNNMGIWVGSSEKDLQLVVRTGESIAGNTLATLTEGSGQLDLSEAGIAWVGGFSDNSSAVVFSKLRRSKHD